jgi:hypothetical protein
MPWEANLFPAGQSIISLAFLWMTLFQSGEVMHEKIVFMEVPIKSPKPVGFQRGYM